MRAASSRSGWAPDGYPDLLCQFLDDPALWVPEEDSATTNATLEDGTPIAGTDPHRIASHPTVAIHSGDPDGCDPDRQPPAGLIVGAGMGLSRREF